MRFDEVYQLIPYNLAEGSLIFDDIVTCVYLSVSNILKNTLEFLLFVLCTLVNVSKLFRSILLEYNTTLGPVNYKIEC